MWFSGGWHSSATPWLTPRCPAWLLRICWAGICHWARWRGPHHGPGDRLAIAAAGLKEDTAIGVVFPGMFAFGLLVMSRMRTYRDLSHILLGNLLAVTNDDLAWMAGVALMVFVTLFLFHKELELTAFDPTHAEVMGLKPDRMHYLLFALLALAIVTAIQVVGVILTSALLVTPAATAVLIAKRFRRAMFLAAAIAAVASVVGIYISYYLDDTGPGAAIVVICTAAFIVTWVINTVCVRFAPGADDSSR